MRLVGGNGHRSGEGAAKGDPSADRLAGAESNVKDPEQWVCWRSEVRGRDGKKTKVPYSPRSGLRARSDDPDTWATLAEYASLYRALSEIRLPTDRHGDPNQRSLELSTEARNLFARAVDALAAEAVKPGFPSRLEGVWSKLRGYLSVHDPTTDDWHELPASGRPPWMLEDARARRRRKGRTNR